MEDEFYFIKQKYIYIIENTLYFLRQDMPFVTVIIPCRNEENHISDCLNSVLQFD